jgi:hypothetical protein
MDSSIAKRWRGSAIRRTCSRKTIHDRGDNAILSVARALQYQANPSDVLHLTQPNVLAFELVNDGANRLQARGWREAFIIHCYFANFVGDIRHHVVMIAPDLLKEGQILITDPILLPQTVAQPVDLVTTDSHSVPRTRSELSCGATLAVIAR